MLVQIFFFTNNLYLWWCGKNCECIFLCVDWFDYFYFEWKPSLDLIHVIKGAGRHLTYNPQIIRVNTLQLNIWIARYLERWDIASIPADCSGKDKFFLLWWRWWPGSTWLGKFVPYLSALSSMSKSDSGAAQGCSNCLGKRPNWAKISSGSASLLRAITRVHL